MSLTITSPSFDRIYTMYAWRDNNIRLVLTQGEGLTALDGTVAHVKAPKFQLRDERGIIDLTSCDVTLALTRPDGSEDLLACSSASGEAAQGIISCPITASATAIAGQAMGEIRVLSTDSGGTVGIIKFYGVHIQIYKGVSDAAVAQSMQYSALIDALRKVVSLQAGDIAAMDDLDNGNLRNGTNPVASGNLKTFLEGNYLDYLGARFARFKYAHEAHSSGYDVDTNPVDTYSDGGVYIDEALELGAYYIIKNSNGASVGFLLCACANGYARATQIALYSDGRFSFRYRHSDGSWDENWSSIELRSNKDSYNASDTTYFGITDSESKFPNSKSLYKFIQANAQAIIDIYEAISDSTVLGYDSLTIDKEFNIHKDVVEEYLNDSDYASDTSYTISKLDDISFGYETHGRPNKEQITIPTGGVAIKYKDTATGREWTEPTESTTYIQNLIPNHIYVCQVLDANGAVLKTVTAKASGKVRMINAGGDTYNIRDIGGWAANGGTLKYGVIYRGGELNSGISITSAQQAFFRDALGVRDEIDLRDPGFGSTALGIGVDYIHIPLPYFTGTFSTSNYEKYAGVVKRIAKDISENKPVYIHCQAGADRTAMACLFVEAICGVSQNDIDRDYELTSFSKEPANDWSNRILRKRNSTANYHLKNIVSVINTMAGATFNDRVIMFLLRTGVSIDELNTIRFGLIDGNPSKLTNPYGTATITKSLSHIFIDNDATSVELYQPYEATLTVEDWYKMTSMLFTMDGNDASSYYSNGKISIPRVTGNIVISATTSQTKIIPGAMLADGAVTEDKLADGSVTQGKIGTKAVSTNKIDDEAVTHAKLAANAVETANIKNSQVTPEKLSFTAVRYVGSNDIDECVESGVLYRVYYGSVYELLICGVGTYSRTQYLIKRDGGIQYRTAQKSNDEWGTWGSWYRFTTEDNVATMITSNTPKKMSVTVRTTDWSSNSYDITSLMPAGANENTKVDAMISGAVQEQLIADGCGGIYVSTDTSNSTTTFTMHALYNTPTANITVQLILTQLVSI